MYIYMSLFKTKSPIEHARFWGPLTTSHCRLPSARCARHCPARFWVCQALPFQILRLHLSMLKNRRTSKYTILCIYKNMAI